MPSTREALVLFTNATNKTQNRLWEDRPVCKSKIVHGHLTYCVSYCVSVIISSSRIVAKRRTTTKKNATYLQRSYTVLRVRDSSSK